MADIRNLVDTILSQTDIVTVISAYIPVIKKGNGYAAICPFHDDHHPSMSISKEKQIFRCFTCGVGGNAISFVEQHEHIPFMAALRKVAEIMGIEDKRLNEGLYEEKKDPHITALYSCINDLNKFYQYALSTPEGERAREYLKKRSIDEEAIQKYQIGYALLDGKKTVEYLQRKGHSLKSIDEIGIAKISLNGSSDSNAGRVIFPLLDQKGQVVGFSARKLTSNDDAPKYVNSPETIIFKKGNLLYNYYHAKESAKRDGYIYLLEGFMDVIALNKAGINSAIALMGTALTSYQISLLRQLGVEIRLSLDGDNAGQEGMMKIISQLNKASLPFRIVSNPGDLRDPDDIYQDDGPERLREIMNNLVDSFSFQLNYYTNVKHLDSPTDKNKVMHYFIPQLRAMKPGIDRENTIIKLAKATGYEKEAIRDEINKANIGEKTEEEIEYTAEFDEQSLNPDKRFKKRLWKAERETLFYMLYYPEAIDFYKKNIDNFTNKAFNELANYILDYSENRDNNISLPLLIGDIETSEENDKDGLLLTLNEVANDTYHPSCSIKQLKNCAKAIGEEKNKIYEKQKLKEELTSNSLDEQKKILEAYAQKRRERLKKKAVK